MGLQIIRTKRSTNTSTVWAGDSRSVCTGAKQPIVINTASGLGCKPDIEISNRQTTSGGWAAADNSYKGAREKICENVGISGTGEHGWGTKHVFFKHAKRCDTKTGKEDSGYLKFNEYGCHDSQRFWLPEKPSPMAMSSKCMAV